MHRLPTSTIDGLRVEPGHPAGIAKRATDETFGLTKGDARALLGPIAGRTVEFHERLWAEKRRSVLVVVQGMDASGKDGAVRRALAPLDALGSRAVAFDVPTRQESAHDFLWRVHAHVPAAGQIVAFNRSHYEDVLAARVRRLVPEERWRRRFDHIRDFERLLVDEGTVIVKCFLHVSNAEQRARLQSRIDDHAKRWKFRMGDLDDRRLWDPYQEAYEEALTRTSTPWAPWYVVPADRKWARDVVVAELVLRALEGIDPHFPPVIDDVEGVVVP